MSGDDARAIAQKHFAGTLRDRRAAYGAILDETGRAIDRGLVLFFAAPRSYTGEDLAEFQLHGSPAIVRELLRAFIASGARLAGAGEFTRRAVLNGRLGLHEAAAVADLIDARTRSAARAALANLGGGLEDRVRALRARIEAPLEELAGAIDYPDEVPEPDAAALGREIAAVAGELRELLQAGELGRLVREGIAVAIVGPPNAGKSSVLNALLGRERAIVSEIAGTTRDTIEESIVVEGLELRLVDTAGIRRHADRLEAEGIARSRAALEGADVALVVIDASQPLDEAGREVLELTAARRRVVFANKRDLGVAAALPHDAISGSTGDARAIDAVARALTVAALAGQSADLDHPHLAAAYELDAAAGALRALDRAAETLADGLPLDLVAPDLQEAAAELSHLDRTAMTEAVLDGVFRRFCIGK